MTESAKVPEAPFAPATEIQLVVVKFNAHPHSTNKHQPHLHPAPDVPVDPEAVVDMLPEAPPEPQARIGYLLNKIFLSLHRKLGTSPPAPTVAFVALTEAPPFVWKRLVRYTLPAVQALFELLDATPAHHAAPISLKSIIGVAEEVSVTFH